MMRLDLSALFTSLRILIATARRWVPSRDARPENVVTQASKEHEPDQLLRTVAGKVSKVPRDAIPSAECCAAHLQLLELFVELRDRVEEWGTSSCMSPDDAWQGFVKLAVARFTYWFRTAPRSVIEMETSVPPLDVLMAWHSFMLNPHTCHTFCKAARSDDAGLKGISWSQLVRPLSRPGLLNFTS